MYEHVYECALTWIKVCLCIYITLVRFKSNSHPSQDDAEYVNVFLCVNSEAKQTQVSFDIPRRNFKNTF